MKQTTCLMTLALVGAAISVAGLAGCRGERTDEPPHQFFPDMDDAPKWNPQSHSEMFADGRTMRQPVAGTVAFGRYSFTTNEENAAWVGKFDAQRADFVKADSVFYTGKGADGTFVVTGPAKITKDDLARGQERYNIYCATCHNYTGDGLGVVGSQWSYPLPNFHDDVYNDSSKSEKARDGYIFNTIRNGVWSPDGAQNKMPPYAHALSYDDTWRIVAYVRVLQAARRGSLDDVPADKREEMRKAVDAAKAAAAAATPATPSATTPSATTTGGSK
ncbi:MAG: cytochrome c [Phycisphaerales bacterium]